MILPDAEISEIRAMKHSFPLYRLGDTYVEAFLIVHIDMPEAGIVLWGPGGIRLAVPASYMANHEPHIGGYYVCFTDGAQTFVDGPEFESTFTPVL